MVIRLPDRTVELGEAGSVLDPIPRESDFQTAPLIRHIYLQFPVRYLDPVRFLICDSELGTVGVGTVTPWETQML